MLLNIEEQSCSSHNRRLSCSARQSMFVLAALAATAASVVASPAFAGGHGTSARSVGHINLAVGRSSFTSAPSPSHVHRLRNITVGRVPPPSCPGGCIKKNVGQGDTIDNIPIGSQPGDGILLTRATVPGEPTTAIYPARAPTEIERVHSLHGNRDRKPLPDEYLKRSGG